MQSADGVGVWQLACPECGDTEIEQGTEPGDGDGDGATVHPDGEEPQDSPAGTQGGFTEFGLSCTSGHRFALTVGSHKGAQFIGVVQAGAPAAEATSTRQGRRTRPESARDRPVPRAPYWPGSGVLSLRQDSPPAHRGGPGNLPGRPLIQPSIRQEPDR
jgi:hypothetical protein